MTFYTRFRSPMGPITLATDGDNITALHFEGDRYFTEIPSAWQPSTEHPILLQAQAELGEYFAGSRVVFDAPVRPAGTPFQEAVWAALQTIPPGRTATYAQLAQSIGRPTAVRAVGTAVGRNPICIMVPCHRVLASGGGLGGYVAGLDFKRKLLRLEAAL